MSERTLILLRHAKSDWSNDEADIDRSLSKRGQRQAPDAGRWLASNIDSIDLAVISPANRARSTWDLASAALGDSPQTRIGDSPQTRIDDRVYAASDTQLLDVVCALPDDVYTVVLVGHNPGIEDLVCLLTGEQVAIPTSALTVIEFMGSWSSAGRSSAVLTASGRPPTARPSSARHDEAGGH